MIIIMLWEDEFNNIQNEGTVGNPGTEVCEHIPSYI